MRASGWTAERKAKQRAAIYRWRPWEKSTGPKTETGKATAGRNSLKHGASTRQAKAERRTVKRLLEAIDKASLTAKPAG